jgi:hypothetical protein
MLFRFAKRFFQKIAEMLGHVCPMLRKALQSSGSRACCGKVRL